MKIPGYTLHGDYYLADDIIPNKTWEEACKMKQTVTLPNGKMVIAHTLSKEELETIPKEERKCDYWYWTSTPRGDNLVWDVNIYGGFGYYDIGNSDGWGGARLGFHKKKLNNF